RRRERQRDAAFGEAMHRVLGREQAMEAPRRVLQRRLHAVPAVEDHRPVAVARRRSPRLLLVLEGALVGALGSPNSLLATRSLGSGLVALPGTVAALAM